MIAEAQTYSISQVPPPDWLPVAPARRASLPAPVAADSFERAVSLVREALRAPLYRIEMESARDEFWRCVTSRPSAGAQLAADREGLMMERLRAHFGSDWASGFASARSVGLAARDVMREDVGQTRVPDRHAAADRRALEAIRSAMIAYDWACLAVQIVAHERIPIRAEVQELLEADLTYRPRELYLAVAACRFHRGFGDRHGWLTLVYDLERDGHPRTALGLLFDGVREVATARRGTEFFAALDWTRLTTRLVRGVLTATSLFPDLSGRVAFEAEASQFIARARSRREPRGG